MLGGSVEAYIIPTDDAHQSEYISEHDQRRSFICGFDGSAGTAVVTHDKALLWTDARYYEQAAKQLDANWMLMEDGKPTTPSIGVWLAQNLAHGSRIGIDPLLMSYRMWTTISAALASNGCTLFAVRQNLIDLIWTNQPPVSTTKCITHNLKFAGVTSKEKVDAVRKSMAEKGAVAMIATALDEIACNIYLLIETFY